VERLGPEWQLTLRLALWAFRVVSLFDFAETLGALGRIDFAARLRWLFEPSGTLCHHRGTNSFGHTFTVFHLSEDSASSCNSATQLSS
jgi:hypothetical protein